MDTAAPWKKWAGNSGLPANESGKSRLKRSARCGTQRVSGSSKVSSKRPKPDRLCNFPPVTELNHRYETRRRREALGFTRSCDRADRLALFRPQCPAQVARGSGRIFAESQLVFAVARSRCRRSRGNYRGPGFADADHQTTAFGFPT